MRLKYWIGSLAVASIVLLATNSGQAGILDGLNAYWDMNGNANDTAGNFPGNASATADNGTIVPQSRRGDDVAFGAGKFGDAAIYTVGDSYIAVPDSADLSKGGQDLSISAWFRVDDFDTSWQALLGKGEGRNYRVARQGGDPGMAFVGGTGDLTGGPAVDDGAWHHFVGTTVNGGVSQMYIDGVLAGEDAGPALIINERSQDPPALWIGNNAGAPGREWEGGIDDLAIWNRALESSEIAFLYNGGAGNAVPEPGTVGLLMIGLLGLLGLRRRAR